MLTKSGITQKNIYKGSYIIYYILYALSLIGISIVAPLYLQYFTVLVKIYIAFFLIFKFNPLKKKIKCDEYDKQLIFSSAVFLLLTTAVGDIFNSLNLKALHLYYSNIE